MFKSISCQGWSHSGQEFDSDPVILSAVEDFAKTAKKVAMTQEMQDFWNTYPKKQPDKFLYVRINILGSGEFWGANLNGDYFPEKMLKDYHKTFMSARMYLHHDNDDPKKGIGKPIFATYNDAPTAKRVEILVAISRSDPKAEKTIENIESGKGISVSMGCRVPYDTCSECHNKATSRKEYCDHLKHHMNELKPNGLRICALNTVGDFFDVSDVTVPADPSSGFMEKVANIWTMSSAELAERYNMAEKYAKREALEKDSAEDKESEIDKTGPDEQPIEPKIDADSKLNLEEAGDKLSKTDEKLPEQVLDRVSSFDLPDILGTLGTMGIKLKPEEYTFIVIGKGSRPAARIAYRDNKKLAEVSPAASPSFSVGKHFNIKLAELMLPWLEKRSMFPEFAGKRLSNMNKTGSSRQTGQGDVLDYPQASAVYARYLNDIKDIDSVKVACVLRMYPVISSRLIGDFGKNFFYKTADKKSLEMETYITKCILNGTS